MSDTTKVAQKTGAENKIKKQDSLPGIAGKLKIEIKPLMNNTVFANKPSRLLIFLLFAFVFVITTSSFESKKEPMANDTSNALPNVFNENTAQLIESNLRDEAAHCFPLYQLPVTKREWITYKQNLKEKIVAKTGAILHQNLPLNLHETGSVKMPGYTIKNIAFQTRPGIYATANLYVPDGEGKFPGVVVMMGHSLNGRLYEKYQSVGITLALNGYVSLSIDPWGAGERTTVHGVFEDHGDENNLGFALLDVGETLMGMQITDNIRAVDLLCSLPYVDANKIGATGASGGGNQTMWLAAMDERVKAAVPVVSAGTFEAYVMGSPCICEVLTDGLTFTEEAAVLGMVAPRALKMCNHYKDRIKAFNPVEMLRSYNAAKPVFEMLGAPNNITYNTFDLEHGYWPDDRQAMLGWFNLHLKQKGDGSAVKEVDFKTQPNETLMVYKRGQRDAQVMTTEGFCKKRGNELKKIVFESKTINVDAKRKELAAILRINEKSSIKKVHEFAKVNGWNRFALQTSDDKLIPLLLQIPSNAKDITIVADTEGKQKIAASLIDSLQKTGAGIAIVDLSGTGETSSAALTSNDTVGRLRVLSKSYLLLGKTVLGEWVKELNVVANFVRSKSPTTIINIHAKKEAGLAGLYLAALDGHIKNVVLSDAPVSYLFDDRDGVEYFSTAVHVPGFLRWGDVSLAATLASNVTFHHPVTMSGRSITGNDPQSYKAEFDKMRSMTRLKAQVVFK